MEFIRGLDVISLREAMLIAFKASKTTIFIDSLHILTAIPDIPPKPPGVGCKRTYYGRRKWYQTP